jgi:Na+/melibiose symporter-like transporter
MNINNELSLRKKDSYGLVHAASHLRWDMAGFCLPVFYTDTFGKSSSTGTIMPGEADAGRNDDVFRDKKTWI